MTLRNTLLIVLAVEVLYVALTRVVVKHFGAWSVEGELIRTALRLSSAGCFWYLMKSTILSKTPNFRSARHALFLIGVGLFLLTPVMLGRYSLRLDLPMLAAAASVPVAIKEELLFRGIVQNLLETRFGLLAAVVATNILFVVWHIGVVPPSLWAFSQIFLAGSLLGFVYAKSGSIALAIGLHALYDAIFSFTPILPRPFSANWGFMTLAPAFALIAYWALLRGSADARVQPTPANGCG
jgi:membrane protease YdiL (CAAX protease family)